MNQQIITEENATFISILSDYVNGRKSHISLEKNIEKIKILADKQQLSSIVYYQTHLSQFQSSYALASYCGVNRKNLTAQINSAFEKGEVLGENGSSDTPIKYLIFKGIEIAKYAQQPMLRVSGDLDILVKKTDKEKAGKILEDIGFVNTGKSLFDHEWYYHKSEFEVELHHRLLYSDDLNDSKIIEFTDTAWEHAYSSDEIFYHLEPEFHFVFLLLHLRKHFLWAGAGIKQFLDLAIMAKNAELDWEKVGKYIDTCEIEKFASICFALIKRWFEVCVPLANENISNEFYIRATNMVLAGSNFGNMSKDNLIDNEVANSVNKHGKFNSAVSVIFPPYSQIKIKYPAMCANAVIGHILLPVMWIMRIVESVVKKKAGFGFNYAIKHLSKNDEHIKEMRDWGLM